MLQRQFTQTDKILKKLREIWLKAKSGLFKSSGSQPFSARVPLSRKKENLLTPLVSCEIFLTLSMIILV